MMISCGSDRPTTYAAQVVACRWTNKNLRKWSGRAMRDTGDKFQVGQDEKLNTSAVRAKCDEMSRLVAKRLGMLAGPDTFPFCP
jgi:hypothetical protein